MRRPRTGDVVKIGSEASVQFAGDRSLILRITKVCDKPTYDGWIRLTGYVLDEGGQTIERREVFVQVAGVRLLRAAPADIPVRVRSASARVPASRAKRSTRVTR